MPKIYSQDLRKLVLEKISEGISRIKISKQFKISTRTIYRWEILYKKEGHYFPRKVGTRPGKIDKAKLQQMILSNPNITLLSLGKEFNVTASAVSQLLKKLGYRYKKSRLLIMRQMKKNEKNHEVLANI